MNPDESDQDRAIARVLEHVVDERRRQLEKWGTQRHDLTVWVTVLMEEVGEASEIILRYRTCAEGEHAAQYNLREMRRELVQIAAVAVAMTEHVSELLELDPARDPAKKDTP